MYHYALLFKDHSNQWNCHFYEHEEQGVEFVEAWHQDGRPVQIVDLDEIPVPATIVSSTQSEGDAPFVTVLDYGGKLYTLIGHSDPAHDLTIGPDGQFISEFDPIIPKLMTALGEAI
jgi:hypothetical protein